MPREIKLSGGEISALKAIGLSGTPVFGKLLLGKIPDAEHPEFLLTLIDLIDQGYVISNRVNIRHLVEVETSFFRVAPTYSRDLRDALNPSRKRNQDRAKRERRS